MRARQIDFFENNKDHAPRRISHGGAQAQGKRKRARPLNPKRPVHLVLKSQAARGRLSLLGPKNRLAVKRIVDAWARRFGVTVQLFENMGNHLHILVRFSKRQAFQKFLKTISALIARHVTGARKGRPFGRRFWDTHAFTRIVTGRKDFLGIRKYFFKNQLEREIGTRSRQTVEQYERAKQIARRRGLDIWEVLQGPPQEFASRKHPS